MATFRQFSPKFLSKLSKLTRAPLVQADTQAQLVLNAEKQKSFWRPSQLSKRQQNDLRKACILYNVEASTIGLPPVGAPKPLKYKPNKLEKHERVRAERQANIQKNLEKMPQTIQVWKEVKFRIQKINFNFFLLTFTSFYRIN
jgi:hypothetical protein